MPGAHQSHSITPPPQLGTGEKSTAEGLWVKIRTIRIKIIGEITHYHQGQNRLNLGRKKFNLSPIKSE